MRKPWKKRAATEMTLVLRIVRAVQTAALTIEKALNVVRIVVLIEKKKDFLVVKVILIAVTDAVMIVAAASASAAMNLATTSTV